MSGPSLCPPRAPVSVLTSCACVCSWRRASIDALAQKKAAQRRDAKLAQLLAQDDEVSDADLSPSISQRGSGRESDTGGEDGGSACVLEILRKVDAADGAVVGVFGWKEWGGQIKGGRGRRYKEVCERGEVPCSASGCSGWHAVSWLMTELK